MADQWRAHTRTLTNGLPVVFLEVVIRRTLPLTQQSLEEVASELEAAGLFEAAQMSQFAMTLDEQQRRMAASEWAEVRSRSLQLEPFSRVISALEGRPFFRIEGSPRDGFTGVVTTADREFSVPLTEQNIPEIRTALQQIRDEAVANGEDGMAGLCDGVEGVLPELKDVCDILRLAREAQQAPMRELEERIRDIDSRSIDVGPELMRGDQIDRVERAMRTA